MGDHSIPSNFPIIDFSAFVGTSIDSDVTEAQRVVGEKIVNAYKTSGFIYLVNHGIESDALDTVLATAKKFFETIPLEEKLKLELDDPEENRGYLATGRERVAMKEDSKEVADANRSEKPDIKESYPEVEVSQLSKPGQARIGAHTDYGTLTLLFQGIVFSLSFLDTLHRSSHGLADSVGGLQVQTPNGDWVDATPIPGSIVVNAGEQ
ncbi:hypothetical protein HDU93_008182 [Gonapodya sp. JEL0774]|nr:hypothetical protein HDU93_008182 [Gonapodya sp. JEL0774]